MKTYQHFGPGERAFCHEHLPANPDQAVFVLPTGGKPYQLALTTLGQRKSPTGFAWGYGGSGPAALAHAILFDLIGNETIAEGLYQDFKREVIALLPEGTGWIIREEAVRSWLATAADRRHG